MCLIVSLVCVQKKVRELGRILNVPVGFLKRHPFPGPGLAVRVLGDVTQGNALEVLRQASLFKTLSWNIHSAVTRLPNSIFVFFFSVYLRLMRSSSNQSEMRVSMIPSGKLSQCSYL